MSSLSSLLGVGTSAMFAAQAQIQTTGHNIANASVEGYSRQTVALSTNQGMYTGAGYFGRGVQVQTVSRAVSAFQTDEAALTKSAASSDQTRADMLSRLEGVFGSGESGIGYAAAQFLNSFSDIAAKPDDLSARQVTLARAKDLTSLFGSSSDQLSTLQASVNEDVQASVKTVNDLASQIAGINAQLAGYRGSDQTPNDLLDKRDKLISDMSQYVQVTRVEQDDGSMNLFVGGNQTLVLGANAYQLEADTTSAPPGVQVGINVGGTHRALSADQLGGGSIQGLLQFQDDDLKAISTRLDEMAQGISSKVNAVQLTGNDLDGVAGTALFTGTTAATISVSTGFGPRNIAAASSAAPATGAQSNANALAFVALGKDGTMVTDSATSTTVTFGNAFSSLIADLGVRSQSAQRQADVSGTTASQAEQTLAGEVGVNLDEEAARLIQYQQSYQAAAKVLQVAQKVFDTVLSIGS